MAKVDTFLEFAKVAQGADGFAEVTEALGGETSDTITTPAFVNMKLYDKCIAVAIGSLVVSTHVITMTLYEATAAAGTGSTAISGKSTTYTSTDTDDEFSLVLEVDADEMTDAYNYIGAKVVSDDADGSEGIGVTLIPMNPRYAQGTMLAAT